MPLHVSDEEHLTTSTAFVDLPRLPKRLIFLGAGFISLEFAHIAASVDAGAQILEREARVLAPFDDELIERPSSWITVFDAKTERKLWHYNLGAGVNASQISYEINGEQFIAEAAGGNFQLGYSYGDTVASSSCDERPAPLGQRCDARAACERLGRLLSARNGAMRTTSRSRMRRLACRLVIVIPSR